MFLRVFSTRRVLPQVFGVTGSRLFATSDICIISANCKHMYAYSAKYIGRKALNLPIYVTVIISRSMVNYGETYNGVSTYSIVN